MRGWRREWDMTLPEGWKSAPLGAVTDFIVDGSHNPPAKQSTGLPMLSARNIHDGALSYEGRLISEADFLREDRRTNVAPGDVLLTIVGTIGRAAVVPIGSPRFTLQRSVAVIKPGQLVPKFLMYQMQSSGFQRQLTNSARGTAQKGVYLRQLGDMGVKLAPLPQQSRIVARIEELFSDLDAGVAALERVRIALKRYRASVLKAGIEGRLTEQWRGENPDVEPADELLRRILEERRERWEREQLAKYEAKGQKSPGGWRDKYHEPVGPEVAGLPTLPDGWCWATVQQLADIQGGIQKQPSRAPRGNAFPYLRVANVLMGRLDVDRMEYFELLPGELERLRLESGDVLIVEGNGSRDQIGRSAVWRGEIPNCVHQNHIIRVRPCVVNPDYLSAYWNSIPGRRRVTAVAASTSGLYTLSVGKVASLPIPLPPLAEQSAIVGIVLDQVDVVDRGLLDCAVGLSKAARVRQSILKRAFAGCLVPQDPTDEPASALLDRIKAERDGVPQITKTGRRPARQSAGRKGYTLVPLPLDEME